MRILITGGSRGIGAAIAAKYASIFTHKAVITVLGRSMNKPSHTKTPGTLLETVERVESFGAKGVAVKVDMQNYESVSSSLKTAIDGMGGLDILVNNASALYASQTLSKKQMDLLHNVNARATLLAIELCKPALQKSRRGSIVTISPPLRLGRLDWITRHPAYTISKYSMTLATLGAASETVHANCLWPRHTVATSATKRLEEQGFEGAYTRGRSVTDVARAVCELSLLNLNAQTVYDDEVVDLATTEAPLDMFARECTKRLRRH